MSSSVSHPNHAPIIMPHKGIWPTIATDAYISPGVVVVGDVHIGSKSSVWFGSVLRGDVNCIRIGRRTNIQDGTIIHVTHGGSPTLIGDNVTVAHGALLHACTLENHAFVGMRAMVMDNAVIERESAIAAGTMITEGKRVKTGDIWIGWPAKTIRKMSETEKNFLCHELANRYVDYSRKALEEKVNP